MTAYSIILENVRFCWPGKPSFGLSIPQFDLRRGESVLIRGESGSGKSTLISLISGVLTPLSGRIEVEGTEIGKLSPGERDKFRATNIGLIFQQFNLLPYARVLDNILLPLYFSPARRQRVGNVQTEALRLCQQLGLSGDFLKKPATRLSVGQQQRVAAVRALIGQPALIIADEPTSALDSNSQHSFLELLFNQVGQLGASVLIVSHDARLGENFDRVLPLEQIATFGITSS